MGVEETRKRQRGDRFALDGTTAKRTSAAQKPTCSTALSHLALLEKRGGWTTARRSQQDRWRAASSSSLRRAKAGELLMKLRTASVARHFDKIPQLWPGRVSVPLPERTVLRITQRHFVRLLLSIMRGHRADRPHARHLFSCYQNQIEWRSYCN